MDWDNLINTTAPNIGSNATLGDIIGGRGYFPGIVIFFYIISGLALLVYLLIGGFSLMTSGGDPKKIESGKQTITNALIGLIIVFFSFWIVQLIGLIFGLDALNQVF